MIEVYVSMKEFNEIFDLLYLKTDPDVNSMVEKLKKIHKDLHSRGKIKNFPDFEEKIQYFGTKLFPTMSVKVELPEL